MLRLTEAPSVTSPRAVDPVAAGHPEQRFRVHGAASLEHREEDVRAVDQAGEADMPYWIAR